jgi:Fe-S-cluster containining protein
VGDIELTALIQSKAFRRREKRRQNIKSIAFEAMQKKPCQGCGVCCSSYAILLTQADVDREPKFKELAGPIEAITARLNLSPFPDERYYVLGTEVRATRCPMLTPENKCSVYDTRPRACRRYPSSLFWCHVAELEKAGAMVMNKLSELQKEGVPSERIVVAIMATPAESVKPPAQNNLVNPPQQPT